MSPLMAPAGPHVSPRPSLLLLCQAGEDQGIPGGKVRPHWELHVGRRGEAWGASSGTGSWEEVLVEGPRQEALAGGAGRPEERYLLPRPPQRSRHSQAVCLVVGDDSRMLLYAPWWLEYPAVNDCALLRVVCCVHCSAQEQWISFFPWSSRIWTSFSMTRNCARRPAFAWRTSCSVVLPVLNWQCRTVGSTVYGR